MRALTWVKDQTEEICKLALRLNKVSFIHIRDPIMEERYNSYISINTFIYEYIKKIENKKVVLLVNSCNLYCVK